jgi:hypothetical protein
MDRFRKLKADLLAVASVVSLTVFEGEMMSPVIAQPANFERQADITLWTWAPHGNDLDFSPRTVRDNFTTTTSASFSTGSFTVAHFLTSADLKKS